MPSELGKYSRISGDERQTLYSRLATQYYGGASVRAIAEAHGRSYGWTHKMLEEAGVQFRSRGGNTRELTP
jgi:Helix-turn-helix domain